MPERTQSDQSVARRVVAALKTRKQKAQMQGQFGPESAPAFANPGAAAARIFVVGVSEHGSQDYGSYLPTEAEKFDEGLGWGDMLEKIKGAFSKAAHGEANYVDEDEEVFGFASSKKEAKKIATRRWYEVIAEMEEGDDDDE